MKEIKLALKGLQVTPHYVMRWANDSWVAKCLKEGNIIMSELLNIDPNMRITNIGSRILHLAAMSPNRPTKEITKAVMRFLLDDMRADPNVADDYGRTPLTLFITSASSSWRNDDIYGNDILLLMLAHGANVNALFTPDYKHVANCEKWALIHQLNDPVHCHTELPPMMKRTIESNVDYNVCDSNGLTVSDRIKKS